MDRFVRHFGFATIVSVLALMSAFVTGDVAHAQKHSLGSSPPTAPPSHFAAPAPAAAATPAAANSGPVAPVSSGMGAIQFQPASASVPAPQVLTRQMQAEDERMRAGAFSSLGAPGQYLAHGHVPFPHSLQLDFVQLGPGDELDALLTAELDQHIVSAVLVPEGDGWRRVATLVFATSFSNASTTPATFVRPLRSWLDPGRYRAVFHASVSNAEGDFTENEADLRIVNNRAVVILDFVSGARQCDATGQLRPPHQTCELIQRWLEPDPNDPIHRFTLITGIGHFSAHEADDPLSQSRNYRLTRMRSFSCQPFTFSEGAMHFEPTANPTACGSREPHDHPSPTHDEPPAPAK